MDNSTTDLLLKADAFMRRTRSYVASTRQHCRTGGRTRSGLSRHRPQ
jgi:hypothetical protein